MEFRNKRKLNILLNPEKLEKSNPNVRKSNSQFSKTIKNISSNKIEKNHFAEILNLKSVFKDKELDERKKTYNTFLKPDVKLMENSSFSTSKNFFFELKKNTLINNYIKMKNLHQKTFSPLKKKGIMFSNELWSEKDYRRIVNLSDLKPKIDYMKLNQKIKLFNEIIHELDTSYSKMEKFNQIDHKEIINSIFNQNNISKVSKYEEESKIIPEKNDSSQVYLSKNFINLNQKIKQFSTLQNSNHDSEQFKSIVEEKIGACDIDNKKNLENVRVMRNRLLYSLKEKKHNRSKNLVLPKSKSTHRRITFDKSSVSANSEVNKTNISIKPIKIFANLISNITKNYQPQTNLTKNLINKKLPLKLKASELIKSCEIEQKENETLKRLFSISFYN